MVTALLPRCRLSPPRRQSEDAAPARVMVFACSEDQARALAGPLRTVLWGDHKISGGGLAAGLLRACLLQVRAF